MGPLLGDHVTTSDAAPSQEPISSQVRLGPVEAERAGRRPEPVDLEVHVNHTPHSLNLVAETRGVRGCPQAPGRESEFVVLRAGTSRPIYGVPLMVLFHLLLERPLEIDIRNGRQL